MLFAAGIIHVFGKTKGRKEHVNISDQNIIDVDSEETTKEKVETDQPNRFFRRQLAKVPSARRLLVKALHLLAQLLIFIAMVPVVLVLAALFVIAMVIKLIIWLIMSIVGGVKKAVTSVKREAKAEATAEVIVDAVVVS